MAERPKGEVTFLFTDIEGSTKLWEEQPEVMRAVLARHDELLRDAIEANGGYVFKTAGDAFCSAFSDPRTALSASLQAQLALHPQDWGEKGLLQVRMALYTGEAQEREGDYFGPPLNRVSRLLSTAHGGQVLISHTTEELARDALPNGVSLRYLGEHRLRDLAQPEQIFQLVHPVLPSDFPPIKSLDNLSHNLPRQLTSFIGREHEIADIKRLLSQTSLLTLIGVGGCGKTRLALQVAADAIEDYPDGVWLVELAAVSDPTLVPQTVASVLGVCESANQILLDALINHLQSKQVLLLLDNCEHLLLACAKLIGFLLQACRNLRILATSRERLNIAGEIIYPVPSLSLPDPEQYLRFENLTQYEAIRLFQDRVIASQPNFVMTERHANLMVQISHKLDGIPLAIELAAARANTMTIEQISERLEDRFHLLTGGSRAALPRQQTLEAAMDWSYELLTEPERTLLLRLSVFVGGFDLEAVEEICGGEDLEKPELLDRLTQLVEKSLVIFEERSGKARYRLLETVRQYARERLDLGKQASLRKNHLNYYLSLAERAEPELTSPNQGFWLQVLDSDRGNLRAALDWSLEGREARDALRLAGALGRYWLVHSYLTEGQDVLLRALEFSSGAPLHSRAKALQWAGTLAWSQGQYERAEELLTEGLELSRESGDKHGIAATLNYLGNVAYNQGDYEAARSFHEESLVIRREIGDRHGVAISLNNLGNVALDLGDYAGARSLYEQSLKIRREIDDKHGIAVSLHNLGMVSQNERDYTTARRFYEESLMMMRELGDKRLIAFTMSQLAGVIRAEGRTTQAAQLFGAVGALLQEMGAVLDSSEQSHYDKNLSALRDELGGEAFAEAFERGRTMTLEQAIAYASEKDTE